MLKKFEIKNFKNFKEKIVIDFSKVGGYQFNPECISHDTLAKMLIYGKNATGKTNFGRAITDIKTVLVFPVMFGESSFLNADSTDEYAEFNYYFQFGKDKVQYLYRKKNANFLSYEEMYINDKIYFTNHITDEGLVFTPGTELKAQAVNLQRYDEVHREGDESSQERTIPFLRWLINNTALTDESPVMKLYNYAKGMTFITLSPRKSLAIRRPSADFFKALEKEDNLKDFESFLNIMGVPCKLELQKLPDDTIELYFKHKRKVNFLQTASSGTMALLDIYRMLQNFKEITFMYLDEFDAFYHYEMSENMIAFFKAKYPDSQIIMTTHNTNLMTNRIMRPDCLLILSTFGTLTPLCDATGRELREGHNLEKLYISGEFKDYE